MDKYSYFGNAKEARERLAKAAIDEDYDGFMSALRGLGHEQMHDWLRCDLLCSAIGTSRVEATLREVVSDVVILFDATPLSLVTDEHGDKVTYEYNKAAHEDAVRGRELGE